MKSCSIITFDRIVEPPPVSRLSQDALFLILHHPTLSLADLIRIGHVCSWWRHCVLLHPIWTGGSPRGEGETTTNSITTPFAAAGGILQDSSHLSVARRGGVDDGQIANREAQVLSMISASNDTSQSNHSPSNYYRSSYSSSSSTSFTTATSSAKLVICDDGGILVMASHVAPVFYHGTTTSILKRRQQRNQQQLQQQQSSSSSDVGVSQSIRLAGGYDLLHARAAVRKAFTKQQQQDTCSQVPPKSHTTTSSSPPVNVDGSWIMDSPGVKFQTYPASEEEDEMREEQHSETDDTNNNHTASSNSSTDSYYHIVDECLATFKPYIHRIRHLEIKNDAMSLLFPEDETSCSHDFPSSSPFAFKFMQMIARHLPLLSGLHLGGCFSLTDDMLRIILSGLNHHSSSNSPSISLTSLTLTSCARITNTTLTSTLTTCPATRHHLHSLDLSYCMRISPADSGLQSLWQHLYMMGGGGIGVLRVKGMRLFEESLLNCLIGSSSSSSSSLPTTTPKSSSSLVSSMGLIGGIEQIVRNWTLAVDKATTTLLPLPPPPPIFLRTLDISSNPISVSYSLVFKFLLAYESILEELAQWWRGHVVRCGGVVGSGGCGSVLWVPFDARQELRLLDSLMFEKVGGGSDDGKTRGKRIVTVNSSLSSSASASASNSNSSHIDNNQKWLTLMIKECDLLNGSEIAQLKHRFGYFVTLVHSPYLLWDDSPDSIREYLRSYMS